MPPTDADHDLAIRRRSYSSAVSHKANISSTSSRAHIRPRVYPSSGPKTGESHNLHLYIFLASAKTGTREKAHQSHQMSFMSRISSICRGAAMWGLENSAVDTRVIRRSYGFLCSEEWDPLVHDPRLDSWYFDAVANKKRARNRMSWAVCKVSKPRSHLLGKRLGFRLTQTSSTHREVE